MQDQSKSLDIVIITGISGSGKSVAIRLLEDSGYTCIDNLPVRFLHEFVANARDNSLEHVAVAIDVRTPGELDDLPGILTSLRSMGTKLHVIFLDANDNTLIQRYSESRRRHPLTKRLQLEGKHPSLRECINSEREILAPLRNQEHVIDTSDLTPGQLRSWVKDLIETNATDIILTFESFAYKRGVPDDADLVFDVRCLPNPYYDYDLRPLTGRDQAICDWLLQFSEVIEMIDDISKFISKWLPYYQRDTRNYLTIAIGCTGGQHRSVFVAEELAKRFAQHGSLLIRHRNPMLHQ